MCLAEMKNMTTSMASSGKLDFTDPADPQWISKQAAGLLDSSNACGQLTGRFRMVAAERLIHTTQPSLKYTVEEIELSFA